MPQRPWPNERSARVFMLRLDGWTYSEIAADMGLSRSAIAGYLDRHGVKGTPQTACQQRLHPERDVVNTGCSAYEVPAFRFNDDRKHLRLMLASLRELRAE